MEPPFDFDEVFDEEYLYFYGPILTEERSDRETALIVRMLGITSEMRVLDLACGHGRIANRLAARGARVTGLDRSASFIAIARGDAADGPDVTYVRGDMRSLPWTREFDRIVCWFTAFGYFSDEQNRAVLEGMRRALVDSGRAVIEINNRDWVLRNFQPSIVMEREGRFMIDRGRFDPATGRMENERIIVGNGPERRMRYTVRMFTPTELKSWLEEAGFTDVSFFDENGAVFTTMSRRMVVVATAG